MEMHRKHGKFTSKKLSRKSKKMHFESTPLPLKGRANAAAPVLDRGQPFAGEPGWTQRFRGGVEHSDAKLEDER
jgi:hypothetical protein